MRSRVHLAAVAVAVLVSLLGNSLPALADEGLATWYGPGFHGNRMANGQVYDMYDPTTTAANAWPFGTWLKVTNPANGNIVYVQVRDRGGFTHALDLSYAAFAQIADPKRMQVRVQYEVVSGPPRDGKGDEGNEQVAKPVQQPPPKPSAPPAPLPQAPKPAVASPPPAVYVVQPGDTLNSITRRFGVSPQALAKINSLSNADRITVGQSLKLREDPPAAPPSPRLVNTSAAMPATPSSGQGPHVVQSGETLIAIAKQFDTTVEKLLSWNDIVDPDMVRIGDELRVSPTATLSSRGPRSNTGPGVHEVRSGETLGEIAVRYGIAEDALIDLNSLANPDYLGEGQILRLPSSRGAASATPTRVGREYVVMVGDTLLDIALRHGTTVDAIADANELASIDLLELGRVLRLP